MSISKEEYRRYLIKFKSANNLIAHKYLNQFGMLETSVIKEYAQAYLETIEMLGFKNDEIMIGFYNIILETNYTVNPQNLFESYLKSLQSIEQHSIHKK